jgi:hypothetical protein
LQLCMRLAKLGKHYIFTILKYGFSNYNIAMSTTVPRVLKSCISGQ